MQFVYKIIHDVKYKVTRTLDILHTKARLVGNKVEYKRYRIIGVPFILASRGKIVLGDNFNMNNGFSGNRIGFNTPCVLRTDGGSLLIGDNVGMSQTTLIAKGADICIGNNVKIGGGVKMYTTDFHSLDYFIRRDPLLDAKERKSAPISIGDDCFIGAGAIILKGVSIGPRSVIGAGSVVSRDIPADCIAVGNPCRVVKNNTCLKETTLERRENTLK